MILQKDSRLREIIQSRGCYFMSILFMANKYTRIELCTERIESIYHAFIFHKWMDENCYIRDPASIFGFLGLNVTYRKEGPFYFCAKNEFEFSCFVVETAEGKSWTHFVCGDGCGHVTYDPYGVSRAVREGKLMSKRIFRKVNA